MIEVTGDLWIYPADYRVITTNGAVRGDGCCVMGRGCALQAKNKYPKLAHELGQKIKATGNHVYCFEQYRLFTFPVKYIWDQPADQHLIEQSVKEFLDLYWLAPQATYVMPRAGCGNGNLRWGMVRPLIARLPDNVFVIDFPKAGGRA